MAASNVVTTSTQHQQEEHQQQTSLVASIFGSGDSRSSDKPNDTNPSKKKNKKKKGVGTTTTSGDDALSSLFETKIDVPSVELKRQRQEVVLKEEPAAGVVSSAAAADEPQVDENDTDDAGALKTNNEDKKNRIEKDDKDVEDRTVFVGNLPLGTTRKTLAQIFSKSVVGNDECKIVSTRIRGVPVAGVKIPKERAGDQNLVKKVCVNTNRLDNSDNKASSCIGYVVFSSPEGVDQALLLNNTPIPDPTTSSGTKAATRLIRVDRVNATHDPSRSIFVGNLPYQTDEESLRKHVCTSCGDWPLTDVEGVRVVRDAEDFTCRGFAYVLLKQKSMVATALRLLNGSLYMGRELRVQVCGKRCKNKRGANEKKRGGSASAGTNDEISSAGALRRILAAEGTKKRRARGPTDINKKTRVAKQSGVSKRAAAQAKTGKRVKKIEKRLSKGMGKQKSK